MRKFLSLLAILALLPACTPTTPADTQPADNEPLPVEEDSGVTDADRKLIETYVTENISNISTVEAVLGGTFYVTALTWTDDDTLRVDYEDGHIGVTADVVASIDEEGNVTIDSFTVLDTPDEDGTEEDESSSSQDSEDDEDDVVEDEGGTEDDVEDGEEAVEN